MSANEQHNTYTTFFLLFKITNLETVYRLQMHFMYTYSRSFTLVPDFQSHENPPQRIV